MRCPPGHRIFYILVCTVFKACTNRVAVQVQPARLRVGVYRGGGIETPAPIRLLWLLSLRKESNIKKKSNIIKEKHTASAVC